MTPSPDHDQWLAAAQAGDRKALERLLALHSNGVYRCGLRVCRTTEDAEDALQETLWAVTRAIKTFRGAATSITAWMFTIIRHQCYRSLARLHRAEHADLPTPFQLPAEDEHWLWNNGACWRTLWQRCLRLTGLRCCCVTSKA